MIAVFVFSIILEATSKLPASSLTETNASDTPDLAVGAIKVLDPPEKVISDVASSTRDVIPAPSSDIFMFPSHDQTRQTSSLFNKFSN